jgi:hypothetical protein
VIASLPSHARLQDAILVAFRGVGALALDAVALVQQSATLTQPLVLCPLLPDRRLFLLLVTIATFFDLRSAAAQHGVDSKMVDTMYFYQFTTGSPVMNTARALIISCSINPLLHSLPPFVPFILDIPIQVVYLVATIRCAAAGSICKPSKT